MSTDEIDHGVPQAAVFELNPLDFLVLAKLADDFLPGGLSRLAWLL